jgi:cytochrome c-type biogenesis protein CcmF
MQYLALAASIAAGGAALTALLRGDGRLLRFVEKGHWVTSVALVLASSLLLHALYWNDFRLVYVAGHTDTLLPAFYRLTAFWAGQPGSLLFWALAVSVAGTLFAGTPSYASLKPLTRLWYWVVFFAITAFFALLLTTWSDPFVMQDPAPRDGSGLNPLLQHPGMIFHPPLLFLGYAGFVIPCCLALAQCLAPDPEERPWHEISRPIAILAWIMLTAGIVLGAWWAYMELGWGGYWAWDPVENASLIPWLFGTASLHTMAIARRKGKLARANVLAMAMTTISAFFATYLVRSGVVQSVHAFGDSTVGTPLTVFILLAILICAWACASAKPSGEPLAGLASREGFLTLLAWLLLAMALIILAATMWPVLSKLWTDGAKGLDAGFYNRVCLPLAALVMLFMAACPCLSWTGGLLRRERLWYALGAMALTLGACFAFGLRQPVAMFGAAGAVAALVTVGLSIARDRAWRGPLAALGAHAGMALLAIGVAFSGTCGIEKDLILSKDESGTVGDYTFTLKSVEDGGRPGHHFLAGTLLVEQDGRTLGTLTPERRIYDKFGTMQFSEVDILPSLGTEIYASLLGMDDDKRLLVQVSTKPLVNWLWIGGTLMCLVPLAALLRRRKPAPAADDDA